MRLPRFRLRTLMIAVVVAAIGFAIWHRGQVFTRNAEYHESKFLPPGVMRIKRIGDRLYLSNMVISGMAIRPVFGVVNGEPLPVLIPNADEDDWHHAMAAKYRYYASHPWLPIPPDPPEPE